MIRLKNEKEIAGIRQSGQLLSRTLEELKKLVSEGVATRELDSFARSYIESHGGKPWFLGYMNYPASICISLNNEVIHGIPGPRRLQQGDLVSLDVGVDLNGYFSDSAVTVSVGTTSAARQRLMTVTRECLERAVARALPGNRVSDISRAVYEHATANGCGVVREYCGHGTGFAMHEDPQVPNYVGSGPNPRLKEGMVLAIEPMVNAGTGDIELLDDGWTVVTADGRDSAHFEHTIAVLRDRVEILTLFR
ncbi:MAG TPA: type I methionyl aminopeptidase [Spirochaetia bacterium]|nr:type I methionyl aminopeptidase [Spirochaetia bacterium]